MDNNQSRRNVLKGFFASIAALGAYLLCDIARAERLQARLSRVDDGARATDDYTELQASGCRCSCGRGTDSSSTHSSARGSGRRR